MFPIFLRSGIETNHTERSMLEEWTLLCDERRRLWRLGCLFDEKCKNIKCFTTTTAAAAADATVGTSRRTSERGGESAAAAAAAYDAV